MESVERTEAPRGGREAMRRVPNQRRARERVARIQEVATAKIAALGLDAVRMSDVAEAAGISIGSLYQYFPDKAAIVRSLAEAYNAEGRACVAAELDAVRDADGLRPALMRIVDGFHEMYVRHPAMRAIWQATQAEASLQALDREDMLWHAHALARTMERVAPGGDPGERGDRAYLVMTLIAAAVRAALDLEPERARRSLEAFKRMLPREP